MKKSFYRQGLGGIFVGVFLSIIPIMALCCMIVYDYSIFDYFIISSCFIFVGYPWFCFVSYRIKLNQNFIYVNGDKKWSGMVKIQYPLKLSYNDILDIRIIKDKYDSNGKHIRKELLSRNVLKRYIELSTINGQTKRIYINYYSRKQVQQIITKIKQNMLNVGNNNRIREVSDILNDIPDSYR